MKISDLTSRLTEKDIIKLKKLFDNPIPLDQAKDILSPFVQDQDLDAIIDNELQNKGNRDARDLLSEWLKQNIPELFAEEPEMAMPYESPITSHPDITGE